MNRAAIVAACLSAVGAAVPIAAQASAGATGQLAAGQEHATALPLRPELKALGHLGPPTDRALSRMLGAVRLPATATPLDGLVSGTAPGQGPAVTSLTNPPAQVAGAGSEPSGAGDRWAASAVTVGGGRGSTIAKPTGRAAVQRRARGDEPATQAPQARVARPRAEPDRPSPRPVPENDDRPTGQQLGAVGPWVHAVPASVPSWSRPIIAGLLLLLLIAGVRSLIAAARARRAERHRELLASYVGVLQRALVPEAPESIGDLAISAAYRPAEGPGAGGDFYDVFRLGDGRVALILGDVAGHGRDALDRAALTRYTVRAFVEVGLEPRAALKMADGALGEDEQGRFATVAVAVFDPAADTLTYALAGHPPPLLHGGGLEEPLTVLSSPPLGLGLPTGLRQTTVSLSAGAIVCFFTDGLVEARAGGSMLGRENLERLLVALGPQPGSAGLLLRSLGEAADRTDDDMAVCLLRHQGGSARAPLQVEELELRAEEVRERDLFPFLGACGVARGAAASALEAAREAARESAVLVRAQLDGRGASVQVLELDPEPFERGSRVPRVLARQGPSNSPAHAPELPAR